MDDPFAVVSPGGVGFDINCGVRLIRTNLLESDVGPMKSSLAKKLFESIPVGVGAKGALGISMKDLDRVLNEGVDWAVEKGIAWPEDREHCEERGRMQQADSKQVSDRAKKRGLTQVPKLQSVSSFVLTWTSWEP